MVDYVASSTSAIAEHSTEIAAGAAGLAGGVLVGGVAGYALGRRKSRKRSKRGTRRSRRTGPKNRRKRRRYYPRTAGKRKDTSRRRIRFTKNGQPYVIVAGGKARFISKRSARNSRKRAGGKY